MASIKVYVLNFHGLFSHVEIVLENTSTEPHTYYNINRWATPQDEWWGGPQRYIEWASSIYSFDIDANPDEITQSWKKYWHSTQREASILGKNCAVAAQWFLTEFAGIPKPNLSNVSWNHLAFGIIWPSFIECPVTLPGRIMSNAKFHVEAKTNPELTRNYTYLFLYTSMALAALMLAASVFSLMLAATILSGGLAGVVIAGCVIASIGSTYGFFKAHNRVSAKSIGDSLEKKEEETPLFDPIRSAISEQDWGDDFAFPM